jgi:hypothetical protein
MTNVDKYICRDCRKTTFVAKEHSTGRPPRRRPPRKQFLPSSVPSDKIAFACFNHQGKADKFIQALNHGGKYHLIDGFNYPRTHFVLTDTDMGGRQHKLEKMRKVGTKAFFVYPHAARPDLVNDIFKEWAWTSAHFVSAQGHIEVMRAFGYSRPLEVVGWSLCPIRNFKPKDEPREVLFAPIHPRCSGVDQDVNRGTFERLARLAYDDDIKLTVRFVKDLGESGLDKIDHPNISYTVGFMNNMYDQIDGADMVVAHQTFLYLAVARGTPAVAMATDMPTHVQHRRGPVLWARSWKKYEHLVAFPYDIMQCENKEQTLSLLRRAVRDDEEVTDWKRRMIGSPFRRDRFLAKIEKYL